MRGHMSAFEFCQLCLGCLKWQDMWVSNSYLSMIPCKSPYLEDCTKSNGLGKLAKNSAVLASWLHDIGLIHSVRSL